MKSFLSKGFFRGNQTQQNQTQPNPSHPQEGVVQTEAVTRFCSSQFLWCQRGCRSCWEQIVLVPESAQIAISSSLELFWRWHCSHIPSIPSLTLPAVSGLLLLRGNLGNLPGHPGQVSPSLGHCRTCQLLVVFLGTDTAWLENHWVFLSFHFLSTLPAVVTSAFLLPHTNPSVLWNFTGTTTFSLGWEFCFRQNNRMWSELSEVHLNSTYC